MAGVRIGVSADSAGEADALINIEVEHAPGRCDNFPAGFFAGEISADSAGHTGRCSERALFEYASFPAVFPARTLRFSPVSALAGGHAEPAGRYDNLHAGFAALLVFFYNYFSALGGRRAGVCISADSAAAEAEALLSVELLAGFGAVSLLSIEASAEHALPMGRCYKILVARVRAQFWASVRHFEQG